MQYGFRSAVQQANTVRELNDFSWEDWKQRKEAIMPEAAKASNVLASSCQLDLSQLHWTRRAARGVALLKTYYHLVARQISWRIDGQLGLVESQSWQATCFLTQLICHHDYGS